MSVLASDNFNRANESPIASPWLQVGIASPSAKLLSNAVTATDLALDMQYYRSGISWPNDHYSQAKISVTGTSSDTGPGVLVRGNVAGGNTDFYRIVVNRAASNNVLIDKFLSGANTLITRRTATWVDGDILRVEISGTTIKVFQNGSQLGADITDASISTGSPGFCYSSTSTVATIDDWEGGDLVAVAVTQITPISLRILANRGII